MRKTNYYFTNTQYFTSYITFENRMKLTEKHSDLSNLFEIKVFFIFRLREFLRSLYLN
jgi:hypothetical protein